MEDVAVAVADYRTGFLWECPDRPCV